MPTNREKRLARERAAAAFIEKHHGPMADLLQDVTQDIGAELTSLPQIQRDSRSAAEMAFRLDNAIAIPNELIEALDWFGFYLGSLIVIGLVRAVESGMKRKQDRAGKLKKRLEERGPKMAKAARRRIERRIARLEASFK